MKASHLVLACQVNVLLFGKVILSDVSGQWSWFEAQKNCQSQNSSLLAKFPMKVNFSERTYVWTGFYRRTSAWIRVFGCYTDSVVETLSILKYRLEEMLNSAGFCQEICFSRNMSIFAIKDNSCNCLKHLPEEGPVSPLFCNVSCYAQEERPEKPYFEECGGNGTYSIFISGTKDERKPKFPGIFCVSIQCSATRNEFHFEEVCSQAYHPLCQLNGETNTSESWWKSMQICKSMPSSSYLMGDVYLDDINRTCDAIGREVTERSWLGIANEVYNGKDRGFTIREEDKNTFVGCLICLYDNRTYVGCLFENCSNKQNSAVLCMQMNQVKAGKTTTQIKEIFQTTTSSFSHENLQTSLESTVSSKIVATNLEATTSLITSATEKTDFGKEENNVIGKMVIVSIVVAVVLGGVSFALLLSYLCYYRKNNDGQSNCSTRNSNVTGNTNNTYCTLEIQELKENTYERLGDRS